MLEFAPKEMSRHMNNLFGSESRPSIRKPQDIQPQKLGKRPRDEDEIDHPDPKRKRSSRQD